MRMDFDAFSAIYKEVLQDEDSGIYVIDDYKDPQLKEHDHHYLWTLVEENGSMFIIPGIHWVNRMGYVRTEKPWTDEMQGMEVIVHDDRDVAVDMIRRIAEKYMFEARHWDVPEGGDKQTINANIARLGLALLNGEYFEISEDNADFFRKVRSFSKDPCFLDKLAEIAE